MPVRFPRQGGWRTATARSTSSCRPTSAAGRWTASRSYPTCPTWLRFVFILPTSPPCQSEDSQPLECTHTHTPAYQLENALQSTLYKLCSLASTDRHHCHGVSSLFQL